MLKRHISGTEAVLEVKPYMGEIRATIHATAFQHGNSTLQLGVLGPIEKQRNQETEMTVHDVPGCLSFSL